MKLLETKQYTRVADARNLGESADLSVLGGFGKESVDLVVTSPPYPMIAMWDEVFSAMNPEVAEMLEEGRGLEAYESMHQELDKVWEGLWNLVRPGAWVCLNMGDAVRNLGGTFRMYSNHSRIEAGMMAQGFDVLPPIIWRKASNAPTKFMGSGMLPSGAYVTLEHEFILIFRKPWGKASPDVSTQRRQLRRQSACFWEERNQWYSDLWELGGQKQALSLAGSRERSAAYPLEIPYRLIAMFSTYGELVFDPFMGTGTTGLAALALGRNSLGIDLDPGLLEFTQKRLHLDFNFAQARQLRRMSDHEAFLERRKTAPAYLNEGLASPVVTRQETDLTIFLPETLEFLKPGEAQVTYRPYEAEHENSREKELKPA